MAAYLYTYNNGKDIFGSNISYNSPVSTIFDTDGSDLGIITSVAGSINESIQYFLTFDDIIHYLHLGRGVGSLTVQGISYPTCGYSYPALKQFFDKVGSNRGKEVTVSFVGGGAFSGPITSASFSASSEGETVCNFAVQIAVVSHSLGGSTNQGGSC